jgi:hypothetical protein
VRQPREHVVHFPAEIVSETLILLEDLLPQLALAFRQLLVERRRTPFERGSRVFDLARHGAVRFDAAVVLRLDVIRERLELGLRVLLERREAAADLFFQIHRFLDDAILEAAEAAIEFAHLVAEQDVAHFVDAGRTGVRRAIAAVGRRAVGRRALVVPR